VIDTRLSAEPREGQLNTDGLPSQWLSVSVCQRVSGRGPCGEADAMISREKKPLIALIRVCLEVPVMAPGSLEVTGDR
jgi:hypothetical protein